MTPPARRVLDQALTEDQWQRQVTDLATALGWTYFHTHDSRRSPKGFPDLVLARERVIFAELKREREEPTQEQILWFYTLRDAGAEWYLWRPSDWPKVELILSTRHDLNHRSGEPRGTTAVDVKDGTL
jgi:hypothetical protein